MRKRLCKCSAAPGSSLLQGAGMTSPCGPQWALDQFRLSRGTMTQQAKESGFPGLFSGGHLPGNSARVDGHVGSPAVASAPQQWFSHSGEHQAHLEDMLEQIPEPHSQFLIQQVQLRHRFPGDWAAAGPENRCSAESVTMHSSLASGEKGLPR